MDQSIDDMHDYDIYEPTTAEIWATCAWPSLQQILKYCLPFVFWNIAFRITTQTCTIFFYFNKQNINNFGFSSFKIWYSLSFSWHSSAATAHLFDNLWLGIGVLYTWHRFRVQFRLHISWVHCAAGNFNDEAKKIWHHFNRILLGRVDHWVSEYIYISQSQVQLTDLKFWTNFRNVQ